MKKTKRIILILAIAIVANGLSFPVPLRAATAEYMKTVNPGERASLRGVAYAVYQISATNLPGDQGWCTNCSSGSRHTYAYTPEAKSTFSITVDGYSVLNYSSQSAGSGTIDLSRYTNTDAVITVPSNYTIKQTTTCDGGTYSGGGTCEPCGYSSTKTATVTGSIQLYGYPNVPVIKAQPSAAGGATDGSVTFTISAEKATSYRWQKVTAAGVTDLTDGTAEDGVIYSGTSTAQLTIQGLRSRLNGSSYRCVVTGAKGDQVTSSAAALNVTDVTAPKIDYAISPTGETTGSVTVTLRATDADSELAPKPYEYLGESHESGTFTISKNGTYEVYASDVNGNRAKAEIRISNIVPPKKEEITPTPTPKATPVITPAPQQNTPVATEPQTIVIEKVTTQEPSQVPAP
ncbi:MAG: hypothetical protein IKS87_04200, partial [Lachnospiraceae bacterium]|nr:hypothetical protein [Lachnospiraceae bacterium]